MIRLRNPDVVRIERELERLNKQLGWTEPLPIYRPAYSTRIFAFEDFINSLLVILGSAEGIQPSQQLTSRSLETVRDGEQSVDLDRLPPVLDNENMTRTDAALDRKLGA